MIPDDVVQGTRVTNRLEQEADFIRDVEFLFQVPRVPEETQPDLSAHGALPD